MQTASETIVRYPIRWPKMPLAVYREVAAHLRQVEGVQTSLYSACSQQFDYSDSQIGGVWIEYPESKNPAVREQVEQILAYYSERFGAWQADDQRMAGEI